jgi:ABC-type transporter Mla maintaining outer membrane lipid asymmetry ATPase subunit MlaF
MAELKSRTGPAIRDEHVEKRFGTHVVLEDVCLSVDVGQARRCTGFQVGLGFSHAFEAAVGLGDADFQRKMLPFAVAGVGNGLIANA